LNLSPLYEFDESFGTLPLCGVDEAGRGPLAGDVFAAAVILPYDSVITGLDDSKKLTEKKREALFEIITATAVSYSIASASVAEIEKLNILGASLLAMKRAVDGLHIMPGLILVDGNKTFEAALPCRAVIGGDKKSAAIAAASILAKVSRDRYMTELDGRLPQYRFAKHKGYGTKEHYEMLRLHGASEEHRKLFIRNVVNDSSHLVDNVRR
jgi:ribonuclease HII